MGLWKAVSKGLQNWVDFVNSDAGQKLIERADQIKADEVIRTSGSNGLKCSIEKLSNQAGAVCCEGAIINSGRSTYNQVVITAEFKNSDNNIVDKKNTYVIPYGTSFRPGEAAPFQVISLAKNIHSACVYISEYQEV